MLFHFLGKIIEDSIEALQNDFKLLVSGQINYRAVVRISALRQNDQNSHLIPICRKRSQMPNGSF